MSYSVVGPPSRVRRGDRLEGAILDAVAASRRPRDATRSRRRPRPPTNRWTRSPDDTTSTPRLRAPARSCRRRRGRCTGMAQPGEYSIATRRMPSSRLLSGRPRAVRGPRSARACPAGARARAVRWRARARAVRRRPESGSTSGASPDGRPAGRRRSASAAIGLSPRKSYSSQPSRPSARRAAWTAATSR